MESSTRSIYITDPALADGAQRDLALYRELIGALVVAGLLAFDQHGRPVEDEDDSDEEEVEEEDDADSDEEESELEDDDDSSLLQ